MNAAVKDALIHKLTALADDELVLAHRNSEWTGHAPILEEDIALANLAQDELGHAGLWYNLLQDLDGSDPENMAFFREAAAWRNAQLLELPKGDWAFTMLRQYLFDAYEQVLLARLELSPYRPLADIAAKMRKEERFHLQHTHSWVERLGLGTTESHGRMQRALDELWPYAQQLFISLPDEDILVQESIIPALEELKENWLEQITPHLQTSNLTLPANSTSPVNSRTEHSEHLPKLLSEMQEVARLEPQGVW